MRSCVAGCAVGTLSFCVRGFCLEVLFLEVGGGCFGGGGLRVPSLLRGSGGCAAIADDEDCDVGVDSRDFATGGW